MMERLQEHAAPAAPRGESNSSRILIPLCYHLDLSLACKLRLQSTGKHYFTVPTTCRYANKRPFPAARCVGPMAARPLHRRCRGVFGVGLRSFLWVVSEGKGSALFVLARFRRGVTGASARINDPMHPRNKKKHRYICLCRGMDGGHAGCEDAGYRACGRGVISLLMESVLFLLFSCDISCGGFWRGFLLMRKCRHDHCFIVFSVIVGHSPSSYYTFIFTMQPGPNNIIRTNQ